jgi:hypothetical protein
MEENKTFKDIQTLLNYIGNRDARLIFNAFRKSLLIGRDDPLLIRLVCSRTKLQLIASDKAFVSLPTNEQRSTLSMKFQSIGGSYGNFLYYLTLPRSKFLGR